MPAFKAIVTIGILPPRIGIDSPSRQYREGRDRIVNVLRCHDWPQDEAFGDFTCRHHAP